MLVKYKYEILGGFYLVLQFLILYFNRGLPEIDIFIWFCNHSAIFFAIGFFFRKFDLIKGLISVGFVSQLAWFLDLIFRLLFGFYVLGITDYVFEMGFNWWVFYPISIHVFSTFIAFIHTFRVETKKESIYYAGGYLFFLYFLTILLTNPANDINCVYGACGLFGLDSFSWWENVWVFVVFGIIVLPVHYLQVWLYIIWKKYLSKND